MTCQWVVPWYFLCTNTSWGMLRLFAGFWCDEPCGGVQFHGGTLRMLVRNSQRRNPELKAGCEPWCPSLKHPQKSCSSSTHQCVCNTAWQISFDSVKFAKPTPTKQGRKMKVVQIECDDSKPSGFPGLAGWKLTETAVSIADIWCQYLEKSLCPTQSPLLHSPSHTRPEEFTQNDLTSSLGYLLCLPSPQRK